MQELMNQFRNTHLSFSQFYSGLLSHLDLSLPEYTILSFIYRGGPITMTQASQMICVSKPAVTHMTDKLEKAGVLKRESHEDDRRITLMNITPKGKKLVEEIQSITFDIMNKTADGLSEQKKTVITDFFKSLSENIQKTIRECNE